MQLLDTAQSAPRIDSCSAYHGFADWDAVSFGRFPKVPNAL